MTEERKIQTHDGTGLYFRKDVPESSKAALVIVHGLCEHSGRYDYLTGKLLPQGFSVYRFDHRGHGRSEGPRAFCKNFDAMVEDINVVVNTALEENSGVPVFLLGHSMGGFAVSLFGNKYPGKVRGIVLSGALTRYNTPILGPLPVDLPDDTYWENALGDGICSDPAVTKAYLEDPLVEKAFSISIVNCFHYGVESLKANCKAFVDPVLVLHGCNDGLVAKKDSRDFYGDIASADKTLKIYSKLFHEIFNEPCKDDIIAETIDWLEKRI